MNTRNYMSMKIIWIKKDYLKIYICKQKMVIIIIIIIIKWE